jgi:HemX protein
MNDALYLTTPLILIALTSGLLAAWLMLLARPDRKTEEVLVKLGTVLSLLVIHWLVVVGFAQHQAPVLTPGQVMVFLGAQIWAMHSLLQRRVRQRFFSVIPLAVLLLLLLGGTIAGLEPGRNVPDSLFGFRSGFHITLSIAGMALLLGSGVFSAARLILHRQIKRRSFGSWFQQLPSLHDLDQLRHITLGWGWLLITLSIGSAMAGLYLNPERDSALLSHLHPMLTLWVLITALAAADRFRWLGSRRLAVGSLALSAVMVLLIIVSVVGIFAGRMA